MPPSFADLPPGELVHALAREAMDAAGAAFAAVAVLTGGSAPIVATCARDADLLETFARTAAPSIHDFAVRAERELHAGEPGAWHLGRSTLVALRAGGRARGLLFLHERDGDPPEPQVLAALGRYGGLALAWLDASARLGAAERKVRQLREWGAEAEEIASLGEAAVALARRAGNPVAYLRTQVAGAIRAAEDGARAELRAALDHIASGVARLGEVERDLDRLLRANRCVFELGDAVTLACRIADACGVEVDVPLLHVDGNPADLARALALVLEDATEAARRVGDGRVRVTATCVEGRVVVAVADDGEAPSGSRPGLARAAQIAKRLGGRVDLRSAPGMGTLTTISAPRAKAEAAYDLVVEA